MIQPTLLLDYEQNGKVLVTYVWIGGTGDDIRGKTRVFDKLITSVDELPEWNYDGSSTFQAETGDSEINIRPVALFDDPFMKKPNKLAWCETFYRDGTPANTNFRSIAKQIFDKDNGEEPWFGIEQEYILMNPVGTILEWPYQWPIGNYLRPQGLYYCGVGAENTFGRQISDSFTKACLYAGVKIAGTNAEVLPSQWEYQIGICQGVEIGDHMWISRYILKRVSELYGVSVTFEPKPVKGDWNGSGGHTNYSNNSSRTDKDLVNIKEQLKKLENMHPRMIKLYGKDNNQRLTGKHETSSMNDFSYKEAGRGASVRIGGDTVKSGRGYYEDRRPAANLDPFVVCAAIFSVTCLDNYLFDELEAKYESFQKDLSKVDPLNL